MQNQVLFGGLVTLAVTFVVQVFVIPRVQRRTRGRERWEKDLIELVTIFEEELPRALKALRSAQDIDRLLQRVKEAPDVRREKYKEVSEAERRKLGEADEALGDLLARADRLERRLRLVHRSAPAWKTIDLCVRDFRVSLFEIEPWAHGAKDRDEQQWKFVWERVDAAHDALFKQVDSLTRTMKPPPTFPVRRLRRWTASRAMRLFGRTEDSTP